MKTRNSQLATRNSQLATKEGFTLVELSIVLVIIGLLIGGILVGKSLIESAEINRFISELKQYEIATIQFHKKFKKYPGDSTYFIPPGNGDGRLSWGANGATNCAAAPNASLNNEEDFQFWAHLSQATMLSKTYAPFSPQGDCAGGIHNPNWSHPANSGLLAPYTQLDAEAIAAGYSSPRPPIYAGRFNSSINLYFEFVLNPLMALSVEKKLGAQGDNNSFKQVGLVNNNPVGYCFDSILDQVLCTDENAVTGEFKYFIPPQ